MNFRSTTLVLAILTNSQSLFARGNNDHVQLFRAHDAVVAFGVAALAAATMSVDESFARGLQRPSTQSNGLLKGASNVFSNLGFPGSAMITAGTYFLGLGRHSRPIAALGMDTGEAIVLGGVLAEGLQMTIGRSRPQRDINSPRDFHFGKGFSNDDYTSLPSAHVTVAFAAATAASCEVGRSWPGASKYVAPISYATAALVGASRMRGRCKNDRPSTGHRGVKLPPAQLRRISRGKRASWAQLVTRHSYHLLTLEQEWDADTSIRFTLASSPHAYAA